MENTSPRENVREGWALGQFLTVFSPPLRKELGGSRNFFVGNNRARVFYRTSGSDYTYSSYNRRFADIFN